MSIDNMKKQAQGLYEESKTNADELFTYDVQVQLIAAATAGDPAAEHGWVPVPFAGEIQSVNFTQSAALAADPTNYATWNLVKRDAAGLNNVVAALRASTTAILQYGKNAMTVTRANAVVVEGGALSLTVTKTGTGQATTAGVATVRILKSGS